MVQLAAPATGRSTGSKAAASHQLVDLASAPAELEEIFSDLYREGGDGR